MRGVQVIGKYGEDTIDPESLIADVCSVFDVTADQIKSPSRAGNICEARHIIMYLLTAHSKMKCVSVAKMFNRDHTSVIYARERIQGFINMYPKYKKFVNDILSGSLTALIVQDFTIYKRL